MNAINTGLGCLAMDFDGVHTDNKVYLSEDGKEAVVCSREDGLGISNIKRWLSQTNQHCKICIVSTETNIVVQRRAEKLGIDCIQGVADKGKVLKNIRDEIESDKTIVFIGNDLNDLTAFEESDFRVCPSDAHPLIKMQADLVLKKKGGEGCVRELTDYLMKS